jgi:putative Mg2+ transporter-C (MgtC) family protein
VGLALGAGMFLAAGAAEFISLVTLFLLERLEKRFFPAERNKVLELSYKNSRPNTKEALDILNSFNIRTQSVDMDQGVGKGKGSKLRLLVGLPENIDINKLTKALKTSGDVERIEMKEKY